MKIKIVICLILFTSFITAQQLSVKKIEPPNWWIGMKLNKIQLMVYGTGLHNISASFNDARLKVKKIYASENPEYSFVDIEIPAGLPADLYQLTISKGKESVKISFPLLKRESSKESHKGFTQEDIIYLIMPDRFANGDVSNDSVPEYSDSMQKTKGQGRAGGDLQGIINKLDYIKGTGFTTMWLTPVVENNTYRSYHGYAATDFYKIDPRFGTNELYKKFVEEAHKKDLKVILDHVANHCSDDHPWMKNPPASNWFNGTLDNHLDANHNKMVFSDLYADSATIKHVERGWFVRGMPDLNQENKFVQKYIIQNTIWWMEYAGLDAIREDTYPYNNQKFMADWAKAVLNEYPASNIVGEVWTGEADFLSTYQRNNHFRHFNTNLPALTDFALRDVLIKFVEDKSNVYHIYNVLAKDFLYAEPDQLVTFADNHDLPRVMYFAKDNIAKAKMVYSILLTTRGIPQIFYGSEIGMVGTNDHGTLRIPFPGGFPGDARDAFTSSGRTDEENEIYNHIKNLITLRKKFPALAKGKLLHFPPSNDAYIYFRILGNEKFMIVANGSRDPEVSLRNAASIIPSSGKITNLSSEINQQVGSDFKIRTEPMTVQIFRVE